MMRFAILCLALAGCLTKGVDDLQIPCDTDDQCPTNAFCETFDHVCRVATDDTLPMLTFGGLGFTSDGPFKPTLTATANDFTPFEVEIKNAGKSVVDIDFGIAAPACLHVEAMHNHPTAVNGGDSYSDTASIEPDAGCASPANITIQATADNREFDFAATIVLQ